jgi:hypothetical protein
LAGRFGALGDRLLGPVGRGRDAGCRIVVMAETGRRLRPTMGRSRRMSPACLQRAIVGAAIARGVGDQRGQGSRAVDPFMANTAGAGDHARNARNKVGALHQSSRPPVWLFVFNSCRDYCPIILATMKIRIRPPNPPPINRCSSDSRQRQTAA